MSAPAPPTNVTLTVDSNDQITLTWDYDPAWFAFDGDDGSLGGFNEGRWYAESSVDHFEIEISRDGNGYVSVNGGPDTVSYDESTAYTETYGTDDTAGYYTKVGTGSLFKFRVRAVNSHGTSSWASSTTVTTGLYSVSSVEVSVTSNSELSVSWTIEDGNTDGHEVQYRKDGTTTWSTFSDLGASVESETINSLSQDTTYEVRVNNYTQYTASQSSVSTAATFLSEVRSTSTHSCSSSSLSRRVVDLLEGIGSHGGQSSSSSLRAVDVNASALSVSNLMDSASSRGALTLEQRESDASELNGAGSSLATVVDLQIEPKSHLESLKSISDREALTHSIRGAFSHLPTIDTDSIRIIDLSESVESHGKQFRSSIYNNRTSLELLDHKITWRDEEAVWYTNWFQESKILRSEDSLAVRSLVIENSKEPAATVVLQYDENGNGEVDEESHPVRLGSNQTVEKFSGMPVDEYGYYRLRISEYSGYNSLYALDTAIIH